MSISSLQSNIERAQSDIASLTNKLSDYSRKLSDKSGRLADAQSAASRTTSASTAQSKLREIASLQKDIAGIEKDKADVEKRIGDKRRDLHRYEQDLAKEQERETKKRIDDDKKHRQEMKTADEQRKREMEEYQRRLDSELSSRRSAFPSQFNSTTTEAAAPVIEVKMHDLFISHASEDKDDFVRPLATALSGLGLDVWYDETTLKLGDSLRQSIDKGLANSRYGLVVFSTAFFAKNWTQYELNGMVAREMNGVKVILPIWHKVTKDEVMSQSPSLADKLALNSSMFSVAEIAEKIAEVVRG